MCFKHTGPFVWIMSFNFITIKEQQNVFIALLLLLSFTSISSLYAVCDRLMEHEPFDLYLYEAAVHHVLPCFTNIQLTNCAVIFWSRCWRLRLVFLPSGTSSSSLPEDFILQLVSCTEEVAALSQEVFRMETVAGFITSLTCWVAGLTV